MATDASTQNLTPLAAEAHASGQWWCYWKAPEKQATLGVGADARLRAERLGSLPNGSGFLTVAFDGIRDGAWASFEPLELVVPSSIHYGALEADSTSPGPAVEFDPNRYPESVRSALRAIDAGLVQKVVVAREEFAAAADPVATLSALEHAFPNCYLFAVGTADAVFLGATPERLIEVHGSTVETSALAGTSAPGEDDLLHSDKDLREHRWVVDAIEAALEPSCAQLDIPDEPELLRLSNVQHLHTPIRGTLQPEHDWRALVDRLHPTPAVCGEPRAEARRLIREVEAFDRGLYAGIVGWVESDDVELAVALRSGLFRPDETRLYAGAGIVEGSDPNAEHRETVSKLQAVARWLRSR